MKVYDHSSDSDDVSSSQDDDSFVISRSVKKNSGAKRNRKRVLKVIVNVANTQYRVIKEVAHATFDYQLSCNVGEDWDLMWADTGVTTEIVSKMKPYQKINHFPTMSCLARKNNLAKNLMQMRRVYPKEYNFFPPTWVLPMEYNEFRAQHFQSKSKGVYIVKPEAMSQGKGIFLIRSPDEIYTNERCVVQRYVKDPFLIEDLKFDLRVYVLVYGCDPLRIYMHKEGLARLATEEYEAPTRDNIGNMYMHLTNYAINKANENFVFNTDAERADVGSKRSLSFVWSYVDRHGGRSEDLKKKIKRMIVKSVCAVQPQLARPYRTCQPNDIENNMCFEILGFDILLDSQLKPWLLEVNHSPSFTTDSPFDHKVKRELVFDTFKLLHMDPGNRVKYYKQKEEEFHSKALGRVYRKPSRKMKEELRKQAMIMRDQYELKNMGGYIRIYPDEKWDEEYEKFIKTAENAWEEFHGYKKRTPFKASEKRGIAKSESKKSSTKNNTKFRNTKTDNFFNRKDLNDSQRSSVIRTEDYNEQFSAQQEEPVRPKIKVVKLKKDFMMKGCIEESDIGKKIRENIKKKIKDGSIRKVKIKKEVSNKKDEVINKIGCSNTKVDLTNEFENPPHESTDKRVIMAIRTVNEKNLTIHTNDNNSIKDTKERITVPNILEDPVFGIYKKRGHNAPSKFKAKIFEPVEFPLEAKKSFLDSY